VRGGHAIELTAVGNRDLVWGVSRPLPASMTSQHGEGGEGASREYAREKEGNRRPAEELADKKKKKRGGERWKSVETCRESGGVGGGGTRGQEKNTATNRYLPRA